jgi:hypothetical protein
MSASLQISFITKSGRGNPYEGIRNVGGLNPDGTEWLFSELAAINGIKNGKWQFHVARGGRNVKVLVARTPWGYEYLRTEEDDDIPHVLLGLPEHRRTSQSV